MSSSRYLQESYRRKYTYAQNVVRRFARQEYLSWFLDADKDRDGYISKVELRDTLYSFNYPVNDFDLNLMFRKTDLDKNGYISLDEYWIAMGQPTGRMHVCKMLLRLFRVEDKRLEGKVSWRSFLTVMSSLKVTVTTMEMTRVQEVAENLEPEKDVIYDVFIKNITRLWDEIDELERFWRRADADGDGYLTQQELLVVLKKEGYTDEQVKQRFKEMDRDGDGKITYKEYMIAMTTVSVHVHKTALMRKFFLKFDTNGDGKVGKKEMRMALEGMGKYFSEKQMQDIMAKADKDNSGEIEFEEFVEQIDEIFAMEDAYQKFFREADDDNNGYLTVGELVKALKRGGYRGTEKDIKRMFFDTDVDNDRRLDFEEYMVAMGKMAPVKHKEAILRNAFESYDTNRDGTIDETELKAVWKDLGKTFPPKDIKEMMKKVKLDKGSLKYEDFVKLMTENQ